MFCFFLIHINRIFGFMIHIKECSICNNNPDDDCIQDCNDEWGESAVEDECGICGGDNSSCSGCLDDSACNYDYAATIDDESCIYSETEYDCYGEPLSLFNGLIPENFSIHSIYPNPFNPITNIIYGLSEHVNVQILVYDLSGKQVETLINDFQTPGYHSVNWNADNFPSGVYLIRMKSGGFTQTQKVVLIK